MGDVIVCVLIRISQSRGGNGWHKREGGGLLEPLLGERRGSGVYDSVMEVWGVSLAETWTVYL